MEWSTAVGLSGISAAVIALVVTLVVLINRVHTYGEEALAARENALEQASLKRRAEDARDAMLVERDAALGERDAALASLENARDAARELLRRQQSELLGRLGDAQDADDLVDLTHRIFGLPNLPTMPAAGGAGEATSGGDQGPTTSVPAPR